VGVRRPSLLTRGKPAERGADQREAGDAGDLFHDSVSCSGLGKEASPESMLEHFMLDETIMVNIA
jgi:hypothetical protein